MRCAVLGTDSSEGGKNLALLAAGGSDMKHGQFVTGVPEATRTPGTRYSKGEELVAQLRRILGLA